MNQREADIKEDRDSPNQLRHPNRPPLPYHNGAVLPVRRHIPPEPFGTRGYDIGEERRRLFNNTHRPVTDYHWCVTHPPTETGQHPNSILHHVRLLDPLASRDGRGTQIFLCQFNNEEKIHVAKIYDGLYYDGGISDLTWVADRDYSHEAAAYQDLCDKEMDGVIAPRYHNSWTFDVRFEFGNLRGWRPVRMIIIEYVEGVSMQSLIQNGDIYRMFPEERLEIFAKVLETNTLMGFNGVDHLDYCPSCIILTGLNTGSPSIRVIGMARTAARRRKRARTFALIEKKPVNPIYMFWKGLPPGFERWIPRSHRCSRRVYRDWLESNWGRKTDQFGPPPWTTQVSPAAWSSAIRDPEPIDFYSPVLQEEVEEEEDWEPPIRDPDPVDIDSPAPDSAAEAMEIDSEDVDAVATEMVEDDKMEIDHDEDQGPRREDHHPGQLKQEERPGAQQKRRQVSLQNVQQGEPFKNEEQQDVRQDGKQDDSQSDQAKQAPEQYEERDEQMKEEVRRELQQTAQQAYLEIERAEHRSHRLVQETQGSQQDNDRDHPEEDQQEQLEMDAEYHPGGDQGGIPEGLQVEQLAQDESMFCQQLDGDTEDDEDDDEDDVEGEEMEQEAEEEIHIKHEENQIGEREYSEERILDCIVVQLD